MSVSDSEVLNSSVFRGLTKSQADEYAYDVLKSLFETLLKIGAVKAKLNQYKAFEEFFKSLDEEKVKVITACFIYSIRPEFRALYMSALRKAVDLLQLK